MINSVCFAPKLAKTVTSELPKTQRLETELIELDPLTIRKTSPFCDWLPLSQRIYSFFLYPVLRSYFGEVLRFVAVPLSLGQSSVLRPNTACPINHLKSEDGLDLQHSAANFLCNFVTKPHGCSKQQCSIRRTSRHPDIFLL